MAKGQWQAPDIRLCSLKEFHIGENGAGKSTLSKVILGVHEKDEGEIYYNGELVHITSTKQALSMGIAAVYQELTLVPYLTVAQNIFLGREPKNKLGLIDQKKLQINAEKMLKELNCEHIDVNCYVKKLSISEQQMVEIAKALSYDPSIIVFDEPTSTLTEREVDVLFDRIHALKKKGIGIIYVSHRMQEFRRIGDRVTVLRDGKKIDTVNLNEHTDDDLVSMMVGRNLSQVYQRRRADTGVVALETKDLCDKNGKVKNVSIRVNKGEIVGLSGLVGAGRTETAEMIFGIRLIRSGEVKINNKAISIKSPSQMVRCGIGMVTEDRKRQGLALKHSIAWNTVAASLKRHCPSGVLNAAKVRKIAEDYRGQLRIAAPSIHTICNALSGGNQQKVVLAKWFSNDPDIFIFDEPTRGIDIGAKMEIYAMMDKLANEGKAILLISSELPEIMGMSDRIYIMRDGEICAEVSCNDTNYDTAFIGANMLGAGGNQHES